MATAEEVAVYLRLRDEMSKPLQEATQELGDFAETGEKANDKLTLSFTEINQALQLVGKGLEMARRLWDATGGAILRTARHVAENAASIDNLSKSLGVSTRELQELQHVSNITDVSFQTLAKAQQFVSKSAYEAANGTKEAADAYAALGVEVRNADGTMKGASQLFNEVGQALMAVDSEAERTALAMKTLGRSGVDAIPIFADGADKLQALRDEAHELGVVMTDESIAAFREMKDEISRLTTEWESLSREFVEPFVPMIRDATKELRTLVHLARDYTNELVMIADAAGSFAMGVAKGIPILGGFVSGGATAVGGLRQMLREAGADDFSESDFDGLTDSYEEPPAGKGVRVPVNLEASKEDLAKLTAETTAFYDQQDIIAEIAEFRRLEREQLRMESELERQRNHAMKILEQFASSEEERMAAVDSWQARETELVGENQEARLMIAQEGERRRLDIMRKAAIEAEQIRSAHLSRLAAFESSFNSMASTLAQAGFINQKKAGRAQALVSTYVGAAKALELPFPANLAAWAQVLATGKQALGGIESASIGGGGSMGGGGGGGGFTAPPPVAAPTQQAEQPGAIVNLTIRALDPAAAAETLAPEIEKIARDGRVSLSVRTG